MINLWFLVSLQMLTSWHGYDWLWHTKNNYDVVNPFISNILMKFLLTISHIFLMKFVLRFGVGSNDNHLVNSFSLFWSVVCLIIYWYCKEKLCPGHSWEWKGQAGGDFLNLTEICSIRSNWIVDMYQNRKFASWKIRTDIEINLTWLTKRENLLSSCQAKLGQMYQVKQSKILWKK